MAVADLWRSKWRVLHCQMVAEVSSFYNGMLERVFLLSTDLVLCVSE